MLGALNNTRSKPSVLWYAHRCFYEKAHSVKGQRGGLREATRSQPKPLRAPFLFAVNKLRGVAGGVSDRPDPSIRRPKSAFRVTRRSFQGVARNLPGDRGGVT
jgi:hypothetical protein